MTTTTNAAPYHTLQSLTDIFREATIVTHIDTSNGNDLRKAGVQAVLEALGYKLPVDPEREAFEKWLTEAGWDGRDSLFGAWKAGRADAMKINPSCLPLVEQTENDGWIPWSGGECPIPGTAFSLRLRDGREVPCTVAATWDWHHHPSLNGSDIIGYKITPQTTTP